MKCKCKFCCVVTVLGAIALALVTIGVAALVGYAGTMTYFTFKEYEAEIVTTHFDTHVLKTHIWCYDNYDFVSESAYAGNYTAGGYTFAKEQEVGVCNCYDTRFNCYRVTTTMDVAFGVEMTYEKQEENIDCPKAGDRKLGKCDKYHTNNDEGFKETIYVEHGTNYPVLVESTSLQDNKTVVSRYTQVYTMYKNGKPAESNKRGAPKNTKLWDFTSNIDLTEYDFAYATLSKGKRLLQKVAQLVGPKAGRILGPRLGHYVAKRFAPKLRSVARARTNYGFGRFDLDTPLGAPEVVKFLRENNISNGPLAKFKNTTFGDLHRNLNQKIRKHLSLSDSGLQLTREEREEMHQQRLKRALRHTKRSIPASFDVRQQWPECNHTINTIVDQLNCGACWAYANAATFTDRLCIANKTQLKMSPQYMIDCFNNHAGCQGGFHGPSWRDLQSTGTTSLTCMPMVHHSGECKNKCDGGEDPQIFKAGRIVQPYDDDNDTRVEMIQEEIMTNGPVSAALLLFEDIYALEDLRIYKRSSKAQYCDSHVVRIIGWGENKNEDGTVSKYWTVANSWGTLFGEGGFFRIARGTNECNIEGGVIASIEK